MKKKAQPSGRKWISYFVYCIYYSYAKRQDESRALLCKNHCAAQRAGVSSAKLIAKQTRQKPLQTPSTQKGWEHSCPGEQLYYFLIVKTDLGWVKARGTGGKE